MNHYNIVFSPTGGTQKVAGILASKLTEKATIIDLCDRNTDLSTISFKQDDICIVAVPSYGGRVPAVAIQRLSQLKGNGARAILTVVYGNREYEDTLIELKDTLDTAGFIIIAAVSAIAEHSIARQFAAGRPDEQDTKELESFADVIKGRLETGFNTTLEVPGNRPYKESKGLSMHPSADKSCVKCRICAESCPVGAIPMDDPSKTDNDKCMSCMRCVSACPQNARALNKLVLAGAVQMLKKSCTKRKSNALI